MTQAKGLSIMILLSSWIIVFMPGIDNTLGGAVDEIGWSNSFAAVNDDGCHSGGFPPASPPPKALLGAA